MPFSLRLLLVLLAQTAYLSSAVQYKSKGDLFVKFDELELKIAVVHQVP